MLTVSRRFRFSSSFTENSEKFYGFNFELWVKISGKLDPLTGFICHLSEVKNILDPIIDKLDHQHLNDITFDSKQKNKKFDLFNFLDKLSNLIASSLNDHELSLVDCRLTAPKNLQLFHSDGKITVSYINKMVIPQLERASIKWAVGDLKIDFTSTKTPTEMESLFNEIDSGFPENMQEGIEKLILSNKNTAQGSNMNEMSSKMYSMENNCSELYVNYLMDEFGKNKNIQIESIQIESNSGYVYQLKNDGHYHGFNMTAHAGHSLNQPKLTTDEAETAFGPCSNKHGHSFKFGFMMQIKTYLDEGIESTKNQASQAKDSLAFFRDLENSWLNNKIPVIPCTGENMISWIANRFDFLGNIVCIETENNQFNWTKK